MWTKEIPKKYGHYWMRWPSKAVTIAEIIHEESGHVRIHQIHDSSYSDESHAEVFGWEFWSEKIKEPSDG